MQKNHSDVHTNIDYQQLYNIEKALRITLQKQLEVERIKIKKLVNSRPNVKICPNCFNDSPAPKRKDLFLDPLKFSNKVQSIISKTNSSPIPHLNSSFNLIHNFAIFGISDNLIPDDSSKSIEQFGGEVLYSFKDPSQIQTQAAKFVFPSGMSIRKLNGQKAKDKAIQMMSFCYTNLKSFILSFQHPEKKFNEEQYDKDQFLSYVNPQKRLFCICIGINDYTWLKQSQLKLNTSFSLKQQIELHQLQNKKYISSTENQLGTPSHQHQPIQSDISIAVTQRVFCIQSYYPFFSFFEDIIRNLINIVKMERLTIYKHKDEDLKLTDSEFQLKRIKELFEKCAEQLSTKILFNKTLELKLINGHKVILNTDQKLVRSYFIEDWVFSILNMFSPETFLDLFTLLMLEDRLVFICDNSHILTYTIYLFAHILNKPFKYAFPVVNIIPNQQLFLDAPFPIVYGMLKKRKYIEQKKIVQKYKNTYIFLSPEKVDIIYTESKKHLLKVRPHRLKNLIVNQFKELKKIRNNDKNNKYTLEVNQYSILCSPQQKQICLKIVETINLFVYDEIVKNLPTQEEIYKIKASINQEQIPKDKDQHSYIMNIISLSLKKLNQDPFFLKFIQTQMINIHLFR